MTRMEGISRTAAKKKARLRRDLIQQLLTRKLPTDTVIYHEVAFITISFSLLECTSITPLTDSDLENILSLINQVIDAEKGMFELRMLVLVFTF